MDNWQGPYAGLQQLLEVWAIAVIVVSAATGAFAVTWIRTRRVGRPRIDLAWKAIGVASGQAVRVVLAYLRLVQSALGQAWARRQSSLRRPAA
jgi:hypothetical protein